MMITLILSLWLLWFWLQLFIITSIIIIIIIIIIIVWYVPFTWTCSFPFYSVHFLADHSS